ncbi:MAG TPA: hypothetical protein DCY88_28620 [Cyanobacteria bacterium UBA11372]|nr:hypothetical protein [Cyanobacteria bacterium UBA11372]
MKQVLALIEKRKQEFALLPLFEYLQDQSIDPRQRLAFAPCLAPLVMGFSDLCKYGFREEPTTNKIQEFINIHTYEEEYHWRWLLEDIQKLELNQSLNFTDTLRFLWGEETKKTRQVCPKIERCILISDPLQKLIGVQVSEVTANVFFTMTEKVIKELERSTKKQYRYFGNNHVTEENNHNLNKGNVMEFLAEIELTDEQLQTYCALVDELFEAYAESMDELLAYAKRHKVEQPLAVRLPTQVASYIGQNW